MYRPYRKGLVRQLNHAQCGQGTRTDCYWAGGLYWGAEPGPGDVLGAAALPRKGGQAEGAGGQG